MTSTPVTLNLSADRKVCPIIRRQGSKDNPRSRNAFGLPAGDSCPGKTEFCIDCYADDKKIHTSAARNVRRNYETLLELGDDVDKLATALGVVVDLWNREADRVGGARVFRIHWDGDFYSLAYAKAWKLVIRANADIQFWAYTRSMFAVPVLEGMANLALYISVDKFNLRKAAPLLKKYPTVRAAFCAETQADCQVLADKLERLSVPCPENIGRLPLVVAMSGKRTDTVEVGDDAQGACVACGLCIYGRRDVGFATSKT
jgi:hypothetical protein